MTTSAVPPQSAPGGPGIAPTWTSSDTAIGSSRLWFTLGHGIVNEVYFPLVDIPQIRGLGFIVADDAGFWVEAKRVAAYTLTTPAPGVPGDCRGRSRQRCWRNLPRAPRWRSVSPPGNRPPPWHVLHSRIDFTWRDARHRWQDGSFTIPLG